MMEMTEYTVQHGEATGRVLTLDGRKYTVYRFPQNTHLVYMLEGRRGAQYMVARDIDRPEYLKVLPGYGTRYNPAPGAVLTDKNGELEVVTGMRWTGGR